jgi:hypothetical protein
MTTIAERLDRHWRKIERIAPLERRDVLDAVGLIASYPTDILGMTDRQMAKEMRKVAFHAKGLATALDRLGIAAPESVIAWEGHDEIREPLLDEYIKMGRDPHRYSHSGGTPRKRSDHKLLMFATAAAYRLLGDAGVEPTTTRDGPWAELT